jgi:hypothetical protein
LAQQLIIEFVRELAGVVALPDPVVEFGALQVEPGQPNDLRPLFAGRRYIGTDVREGPGVDRVEDLRSLSFGDGEIGTSLCLDTLEHCADPITACRELARVTADGGICVISSVMLFPIHAYPNDFWRFTPEGFRLLLRGFDEVWVGAVGPPELPMQVLGLGAKGGSVGLAGMQFESLQAAQQAWDAPWKLQFGAIQISLREVLRTIARQVPRTAAARARAGLRRRA